MIQGASRGVSLRFRWLFLKKTIGFLWLSCAMGTSLGVAQPVVPDEVQCVTCDITWTEVLRLGEGDGPGFIVGPFINVTKDFQGRYWVTSQ